LIFNTKFNTQNKYPFISRLFGLILKGSIPVRSANIKKAHFPAFGQVLGSRSDPAELRREMGLFSFRAAPAVYEALLALAILTVFTLCVPV